jgi:hypothetical protein
MDLCIIGAGVSGLILILLLAETSIPINKLCIVDPYFDGGDLLRKWSCVISNTPWSTSLNAIQKYCPSAKIPKWALELPLDKPTPVHIIAKLLRECAKPILEKAHCIHGTVTSANWSTSKSMWEISIKKELELHTIESKGLCLLYGAEPKELDISIPCIPLDVALDVNKLKNYVEPTHKVIVFGSRHSGVHVLKNLVDCSANSIIGLYKDKTPFLFARDGVYDGIKLDAATIADEILLNKYPTIKMLSLSNLSTMLRETRSADWVIYAMGFEPRHTISLSVDGTKTGANLEYDKTGKLLQYPCTWGFGFAYPSQAPDEIHWDVGVSSFLEHIHRQISSILSIIYLIQ